MKYLALLGALLLLGIGVGKWLKRQSHDQELADRLSRRYQ